MKVSIIIPVYNCAAYILECLNSIREQSYKELEIIIVNDGSTDNSGDICKRICEEDTRFKYWYQENCGPSSARNYGLSKITGDYVLFVDADDMLTQDAILNMVEIAIKWNADLFVFGMETFGTGEVEYVIPSKQVTYIEKGRYISRIASDDKIFGGGFVTPKLWRIPVIKKDGYIKFDNELKLYEDKLWIIENSKKTKKILLVPTIVYKYRVSKSSLSHQNVSWRNEQLLMASRKIMDASKDCCSISEFRNVQDMYAMQVMRSVNNNKENIDEKDKNLVLDSLRWILCSRIISWKSKVKYTYVCCQLMSEKWDRKYTK